MAELKKCPFCGKNTVKVIPFNDNKYIISHWYENISDCPIAVADENTGMGSTYFETEEEAIEVWNDRVTEADIRAKAIDEFAEKLKEFLCEDVHWIDLNWIFKDAIDEIAEQLKGE